MDYQKFKQLSLAPFSCDSLSLAENALRVVWQRYPNFGFASSSARNFAYPPTPSDFDSEISEPQTSASWMQFAYDISLFPQSKLERQFNPLPKNDAIDETIVNAYLELLRKRPSGVDISPVRYVKEDTCDIENEGLSKPTIIPLRDGESWAFVTAYSDCFHYYDSKTHNSMIEICDKHSISDRSPRTVQSSWTGPKAHKEEDSGIYMLLGIRRIQQGIPHLSQTAAENIVESFRARLFIELLCQKIDPSEEEFFQLSINGIEGVNTVLGCSSHETQFLGSRSLSIAGQESSEAPEGNHSSVGPSVLRTISSAGQSAITASCSPAPPFASQSISSSERSSAASSDPVTPFESRGVSYAGQSVPGTPIASPSVVASGGSNISSARQRTRNSRIPRSKSRTPFSPLRSPVPSGRQLIASNFKSILDLLSAASFACRFTGASENTSLAILWHLVKKGPLESQFHERYNKVLFYSRMKLLNSDDALRMAMKGSADKSCLSAMRNMQSQCKFWDEICNIGEKWGGDKYLLLLAIMPLSTHNLTRQQMDETISELRTRFNHPSDQLMRWLWRARELCAAIITQSLPEENLMIDLYYIKRLGSIDENTYNSFVSLNPHEKMLLSNAVL